MSAPALPRPPCFSPLQFQQWIAAARITGGVSQAGYCTDCTPEYQKRMLAEKRCVRPDIVFNLDADGFIQGANPHDPSHHA